MGTRATTVKHRTAHSVSPGQNYREPKLDENHTRTLPHLPPGDPRHASIERNVAPRTTITALTAGHCGRRPHDILQLPHERRWERDRQARSYRRRQKPGPKGGEKVACPLFPRILPGEPHAENAFLVCTRLVRYWDDNDVGAWAQTVGEGSWLSDTPVFAPTRESGQVGRIPSRSKESFPWACTVIRLPETEGFRGWFSAYVRERKPPGDWAFLTIAEGSYSPRPERWPQDKGPEAKPAEEPATTTP